MIALTFFLAAAIHVDITLGGKTLDVRDETNKAVSSYQVSPGLPKHPTPTGTQQLLGDPASHGCIRMAPVGAYALARLATENGGAAKSDSWYQSVISGKQSLTVQLPTAIPVRITQ